MEPERNELCEFVLAEGFGDTVPPPLHTTTPMGSKGNTRKSFEFGDYVKFGAMIYSFIVNSRIITTALIQNSTFLV